MGAFDVAEEAALLADDRVFAYELLAHSAVDLCEDRQATTNHHFAGGAPLLNLLRTKAWTTKVLAALAGGIAGAWLPSVVGNDPGGLAAEGGSEKRLVAIADEDGKEAGLADPVVAEFGRDSWDTLRWVGSGASPSRVGEGSGPWLRRRRNGMLS